MATVDPVPCPLGTFMPDGVDPVTMILVGSPATKEGDCIECTAGSTCGVGAIEPEPCDVGFFTLPGNSECQKCSAG